MKKTLRAIVLLTAGSLPGATALAQAGAGQGVGAGYPAPGKLVDIGGRKLHLLCTGNGSPTVILVAGGGAYSIDWALVQPRIAKQTRVCSYDRAGLGWSDPGPKDETVEQTVSDLHSALSQTEKGRFILVGASIGGIFIQAYQRRYPEQVAALVFSNSANRVGLMVNGKPGLIWALTEAEIRSAYPMSADAKGMAPKSEDDPFDRLPEDLRAMRLWLDKQGWERWDPTKETGESMVSWRAEFLEEFLESETKGFPLGNLPVVVVSSRPTAEMPHTRDEADPKLDFLSKNSRHVTAAGSGHEIHLYKPEVIAEELAKTISAIRAGQPTADTKKQ